MKCPFCLSDNPAGSLSCLKCGAALEETSPTLSLAPAGDTRSGENLKFHPGEKFGDRYSIIEEIGHGGMGRVYKAEDHELGITVVLKMIRPELSARASMIDQFKKETLLGRSISHENVVRIHDLGEINKIRYISMDFIKGENLCDLIHSSGTLTLPTCLQIAIQICQALKAAHQKGIIHQDLKPQNIMIDSRGKVYVTDFGLAKSVSMGRPLRPGRFYGTPRYFPPEQARGEESDQRSDIYSLGVILYEMATGAAPFESDSVEGYVRKHTSEKPLPPSKKNPDVSPACEKIILKCLEKKKEDRYQTVEELLQDLETLKKHGLGGIAAWRKKRQPRTLMTAAMILLLGFAAFGIFRLIVHPVRPSSTGKISIAVMYAENLSNERSQNSQFRWTIPTWLVTGLGQSRYLKVLPMHNLMQILSDLHQLDEEHPLSGTLDRISDATGVEYFVLPSFSDSSGNLRISFIIRKAKSETMLGEPEIIMGKPDDLLTMVDELGLRVKSRLNLSEAAIAGDNNQSPERISTGSLTALNYFTEAEKKYIQGDFQGSILLLERAVKEDPNYAAAYLKMADDYEYMGDYENHELNLKKALKLADRVSEKDRLNIQGYAAAVSGESPAQAVDFRKKLIDLNPDDPDNYIALGVIYRNREEWDSAMEQMDRTLALNAGNSIALQNKVFILTAQGRYKEAIELCGAGEMTFPGGSWFLREKPLIHLIQGQYALAASELENAITRSSGDSMIRVLEGHFRTLRGDWEAAGRIYGQIQQAEESASAKPNLEGRLWTAYLHFGRGEYHQAQESVREGIALARKGHRVYDEIEYLLLLAYSELQLGHFEKAADELKPALEISQRNIAISSPLVPLHFKGLASLGLGRIEEAKSFAQQIRLFMESSKAAKNMRHYEHLMGHIALSEGRPAEAVRHFEQSNSLLPHQMDDFDEHAFYYDGLAEALYRSGQWAKAREAYKEIISLTTGRLRWGDLFARSYYWLGKIHQQTGDRDEAKRYFDIFLSLWKSADPGLKEVSDAQKQLAALNKGP